MAKIEHISSEEILDSRGVPTLKTTVYLAGGASGVASVPSGISTSSSEAMELRDGDPNRYRGMGVLKAVNNAQGLLFQAIKDIDSFRQEKIDLAMRFLDGTPNKSKMGANAILSVSLAIVAASAADRKMPIYKYIRELIVVDLGKDYLIPKPMINLIEGGKHAVSGIDFQEFLVVPKGVKYVAEGYAKTLRLMDSLKGVIKQKKLGGKFGLEGGFAPNLMGNELVISLLEDAREKIEFTDKDFDLGLDIAATSLYKNGEYQIHDVRAPLNSEGLINFLRQLSKKHKLISLEDPLHENDWDGWIQLTKSLSPRVLIIGDDLTATNHKLLSAAIEKGAVTGVVVKPDQIGTVTEALSFALRAREVGVKTVFSHRGGETEDTSIADLATALNADYIKIGSPLQKERFAKYARLMRIEKELWEERL